MPKPELMWVVATMAKTLETLAHDMEWTAKNLATLDVPHASDRAAELLGAALEVKQWAKEILK